MCESRYESSLLYAEYTQDCFVTLNMWRPMLTLYPMKLYVGIPIEDCLLRPYLWRRRIYLHHLKENHDLLYMIGCIWLNLPKAMLMSLLTALWRDINITLGKFCWCPCWRPFGGTNHPDKRERCSGPEVQQRISVDCPFDIHEVRTTVR